MTLVQTRLPKTMATQLARIAKSNERSIAAELRIAIGKHVADSQPKGERTQ